ncbi:MAG: hypothetical protein Q4C47_00820, partial [Planctomycetia bacterium]|nr:hypothetical protein [Planctomycetia bacterium]
MDGQTDVGKTPRKTPDELRAPGAPDDLASLLWGIPESVVTNRRLLETLTRAPNLMRKKEFRRRLIQSGTEWLCQPAGVPGFGALFPTLSSVSTQSKPETPVEDPDELRPMTGAVPVALEAIAWAKVSHLCRKTYPETVPEWETMDGTLMGVAVDASALDVPDRALLFLYLAGELPLTLSVLSANRTERGGLWNMARQNLNECCEVIFDDRGIPASEYFDAHRLIAASLLRCRRLVNSVSEVPGWRRKARAFWSGEAADLFSGLVRHLLRWSRLDGHQVFLAKSTGDQRAFWDALLTEDDDDDDRDLANLGLPVFRDRTKPSNLAFPPAACHSDWAGVATLRPSWFSGAPRLNILYESELTNRSDASDAQKPVNDDNLTDRSQTDGIDIPGDREPISQILRTKLGLDEESDPEEDDGP